MGIKIDFGGKKEEPSQNSQNDSMNPFGSKIPKQDPVMSGLNEQLNQSLRTLRMLEERYSTLRKKMQLSEQNMIEDTNKVFTQIKLIVSDINELKMKISDIKQKLDIFEKEIDEMATRQDVMVLQRYMDMWEPMQFLTEKDAIKLIKDALRQEQIQKTNPKK